MAAFASLLVLGVLVVGEPLMCVLHCHLWMPGGVVDDAGAIVTHQHHHAHGAVSASANAESVAVSAQTALRCADHTPGSDSTLPPSPLHDLTLPVALALGALMMQARRLAMARASTLLLRLPPPTPPPICSS
jgi:hypothetical protein